MFPRLLSSLVMTCDCSDSQLLPLSWCRPRSVCQWPLSKCKKSRFRDSFWVFFAYKQIARPNWDVKSREHVPTVDTNSVIPLPRRSSKLRHAMWYLRQTHLGLLQYICEYWNVCMHHFNKCVHFYLHIHIIYTIIILKYVALGKLQVAILGRSSREMPQTLRIDWQSIQSIRPGNLLILENTQKLDETVSPALVFIWMNLATGLWSPATHRKGDINRVTVGCSDP